MLILDLLECHSRKCFQLNFSPRLVLVPWQVVPGGWCSHLASWGRWRHLLRRWGWCSGYRWAEAPGSRTHQDKFSFSLTISRPCHPSQWWPGCRSSRQPLDLSRGLRCREWQPHAYPALVNGQLMDTSIVLNLVCHLVAGELLHLDNGELRYRAIVDEVV